MTVEISNVWIVAIISMGGAALGSFMSLLVINYINQKKWKRHMDEHARNQGEPDCGCNKAKTMQRQSQ